MGKHQLAVCIALLFCLPPLLASGNTNGTNGSVVLWKCHHNFSDPSEADKSIIYWQGQLKPYVVLHVCYNGEVRLTHQNVSFHGRTNIFRDQIQSGNLSLGIQLGLKDDKTQVEVVIINDDTIKICPTTLYVAVPFETPTVEMNQTDMTATCSTTGGYPMPDVKWTSWDRESGHERTLEALETQFNIDKETGFYNIISKANATGAENMTCFVYNPTSNITLIGSIPAQEKPESNGIGVGRILCIVGVLALVLALAAAAAVILYRKYRTQCGQQEPDRQDPDRQDPDAGIPLNDMPENH